MLWSSIIYTAVKWGFSVSPSFHLWWFSQPLFQPLFSAPLQWCPMSSTISVANRTLRSSMAWKWLPTFARLPSLCFWVSRPFPTFGFTGTRPLFYGKGFWWWNFELQSVSTSGSPSDCKTSKRVITIVESVKLTIMMVCSRNIASQTKFQIIFEL